MARCQWLTMMAALVVIGSLEAPVAQAQPPKAKAAIKRAVTFLRVEAPRAVDLSEQTLGAYAMLKGGAPAKDPAVARILADLLKKLSGGSYGATKHAIYGAGCHLMFLEAAGEAQGNKEKYKKEMQVLVDYITKNQAQAGYWNYLGNDKHGDTSVTQYGILGLWAAARVGISVPTGAWERSAGWLMRFQGRNGGFLYRPTETGQKVATLSMGVAGTSSLLVVRRYLFPHVAGGRKPPKKKPKGPILDVEPDDQDGKPAPKKPGKIKTKMSLTQLSGAIQRGENWLSARYQTGKSDWPLYKLYATERFAALAKVSTIGKENWYDAGMTYLLKRQKNNGGFESPCGKVPGTAFAILFLSKATQKLVGPVPDPIGDGLLRGATGLPTDLSTLEEGKGGEIKKRRVLGPTDELLEELKKPKNLELPEVQKEIVKRITVGPRKQWLEPKRRKQLLEMAEHPSPEVRKVAIWALGRTGNIDIVTILMKALEDDPDLDVAVEARNALCWLSRKPQGFGLDEKPDVTGITDKAQRLRIIQKWRDDAARQWKKWYLKVRPYSERDDLLDTGEKSD